MGIFAGKQYIQLENGIYTIHPTRNPKQCIDTNGKMSKIIQMKNCVFKIQKRSDGWHQINSYPDNKQFSPEILKDQWVESYQFEKNNWKFIKKHNGVQFQLKGRVRFISIYYEQTKGFPTPQNPYLRESNNKAYIGSWTTKSELLWELRKVSSIEKQQIDLSHKNQKQKQIEENKQITRKIKEEKQRIREEKLAQQKRMNNKNNISKAEQYIENGKYRQAQKQVNKIADPTQSVIIRKDNVNKILQAVVCLQQAIKKDEDETGQSHEQLKKATIILKSIQDGNVNFKVANGLLKLIDIRKERRQLIQEYSDCQGDQMQVLQKFITNLQRQTSFIQNHKQIYGQSGAIFLLKQLKQIKQHYQKEGKQIIKQFCATSSRIQQHQNIQLEKMAHLQNQQIQYN